MDPDDLMEEVEGILDSVDVDSASESQMRDALRSISELFAAADEDEEDDEDEEIDVDEDDDEEEEEEEEVPAEGKHKHG
jgi:hypothetical protein